MVDAGAVKGSFIIDDSDFNEASNRAIRTSKKVEGSFGGMAKSLFTAQLAYDVLRKAVGAFVNYTKNAIKASSDLVENTNKFKVVFRGVNKEAFKMQKSLVKAYGMSRLESTKTLAAFQDFLVPMGIARKKGLELSTAFTKMAVDIGSFNNAPTVQVLEAIKSGIAGMSRPMRQFGVDISETTLKQMAMAEGIEIVGNKLDSQTRAQMIHKKLLLDSADAMGDFARTSIDYENLGKQVQARNENIATSLGAFLLPALTKARKKWVELLITFDEFIETNKVEMMAGLRTLEETVSSLATKGFEKVKDALSPVVKLFEKNVVVTFLMEHGMQVLGVAITIVTSAIKLSLKAWKLIITIWSDMVIAGMNIATMFYDIAKAFVTGEWDGVADRIKKIGESFKNLGKDVASVSGEIKDTAVDSFKELTTGSSKGLNDLKALYKKNFEDITASIEKESKKSGKFLEENLEGAAKKTAKEMMKEFKEIAGKISAVFGNISTAVSSIFDTMQMFYENDYNALVSANEAKMEELETSKENQLEVIQTDYDTNLEALQNDLDNQLISKEEFDTRKEELDKTKADKEAAIAKTMDDKMAAQKASNLKKENAEKKKQFEANKANQIAMAWINLAIGTVAAFAGACQWPGPSMVAGLILAGVMSTALLATTIAQTVAISKQQFTPAKALGGRAEANTTYQVNERGDEFFTPGITGYITPANITSQIMENVSERATGKTIINNINFDKPVITDDMSLDKITDHIISAIGKQVQFA